MASSSSSAASTQSPKKYDVFISFRGEDTRNNFTSHLHDALCRNKIETYIDYRLEKGDEVWPSLVKAIEDSALFLIVFSENYASSTWCLNELTKILECSKDHKEHLVIPVFYKIDPSHVRKQKGNYEIAFSKHEHTNHSQQIQKWKNALTQAANLSGWHSDAERNEAELIRVIVKGVLIKLDSMYQSDYSNDFIGINQQIAHLELLLCDESQDVQLIGIWGMGGIGKTTIAKALFNKLRFAFESFCFLANVREELEKHGITHLKSKLFSTLLEDEVPHISMPNGESPYVMRRLGRKKMLIVLDDINDSEQLKNLVGAPCWFGQSSRVIITTRDKQVFGKDVDYIYEVIPLDFHVALQLFNLNAFKHNFLDKEFKQLSQKVVGNAQGIPLALIVLGSFLCGKSKEEWESQLEKLKKMPHKKIQQILKLSYDDLDLEERNIFLDIACFFKGKKVEEVKLLLDACGYSTIIGLRSLQDKALITVSYNEEVSMHDLIQEMGRQIVREESLEDPSKRSRLWNFDDIYEILKDDKGSKAIKGMTLDMSKIGELKLNPQVFVKMSKLKFLEFYNSSTKENSLCLPRGLKYFPNEVRYLRWDKYPLKSLPLTFCAENLVELNMEDSNIQKLWQGVLNVANLKRLNLFNSKHLKELPDFSKALHLEAIDLSMCASLCEVHPSILSLNSLEYLWLKGCVGLTSFKSDTHLRSLISVDVRNCSIMKEFSITSENMKYLDLGGTAINVLPSSTVCLSKLEKLHLWGCENLKNIPSNLLDSLRCLKHLRMDDCCNILELPDNIKHLSNLECLSLEGCARLQSLPELPPLLLGLYANDCSSLEVVQFTSIAEETYIPQRRRVSFKNCLKLDQHSIKAIIANELVKINKCVSQFSNFKPTYVREGCEVVYPGSRAPEWFKYRTTHATSITIDLSSAPLSMDWELIFCFVIPPSLLNKSFTVSWKTDLMEAKIFSYNPRNLTSDHVFLCYKPLLGWIIHKKSKNSATSNAEVILKIDFLCRNWSHSSQRYETEIKEYGICPTYCSEYQNFIKQMKLKSHISASRMGIGCSYEGKTRPPTHSIACLADRRPPQPLRTYYRKRKRVDQVNPSQDLHAVHMPQD